MVERILGWLASPVVAAQDVRIQRSVQSLISARIALHRLDSLIAAYHVAGRPLRRGRR